MSKFRPLVEIKYDRKTRQFLTGQSPRLKFATAPEPVFNDAGGYLTIRVSSECPDRDNEVVVPRTLRLDAYKTNPVVLPFHDQQSAPIALCEDADRRFWCWVDDAGDLWERWYFDNSPEGASFAGLYQRKVLRGASIGFKPDGFVAMTPREANERYGIEQRLAVCTGGELLETSAVPVPSCPAAVLSEWVDGEALGSIISRGYVGEQKVPGMLVKSLAPYAARLKSLSTRIISCKKSDQVSQCKKLGDVEEEPMAESVTAEVVEKAAAVSTKAEANSESVPADDGADTTNADDPAAADPHADVKAGLMTAAANCLMSAFNRELGWDDAKKMLDEYMTDYGKYSGVDDSESEVETDAEGEDEVDDEEVETDDKSVKLDEFIAECRAKFASFEEFNVTAASAIQKLLAAQ